MEKLTQPESPQVSVVFPAYNEAMYLPLMLWTLSQLNTSIPVEIIWVNNASTDRTWEIMTQSGITRVNEPKKGVSYARQAWLEASRWEYIATTDADTQVPETWIDWNLKHFKGESNIVCVSWGSTQVWAHWSHLIAKKWLRYFRKTLGKKWLAIDAFFWHNSFLIKEIANSVGGYQARTDLWEDTLIVRKMRQYGDTKRVYWDMDILVQTSARRVASLQNVLRKILERGYLIVHDNNTMPLGKTFSDIR